MSFCAKPKGEVAESNSKEDHPLLLGEGGPSQTVGEGLTTLHWQIPHLPCRAPSPQREGLTRLKINWILQLRSKALRAE